MECRGHNRRFNRRSATNHFAWHPPPWVETHGYLRMSLRDKSQSALRDKTKTIVYGTDGFDVEANRRQRKHFPWLTGDHWLCLDPVLFLFGGHYRGGPGVEDQFVYVAMLPDGSQRTYTPAEFVKTFNWKNDPEKAVLLGK